MNNNAALSNIDKFNYLKALLDGPAARSIQGLTLTSANYDTALEILQDRFGKKQHIIAAHMDDLLKLTPCLDSKPHHLRIVYDKIFVNVQGLEALWIMADQYGSFLIPVVMSKLPAEVRLQVARMTAKDVWKVEELLDIIKSEVEAREISETIRITDLKSSDTSTPRRPPPPPPPPPPPTPPLQQLLPCLQLIRANPDQIVSTARENISLLRVRS